MFSWAIYYYLIYYSNILNKLTVLQICFFGVFPKNKLPIFTSKKAHESRVIYVDP